MTGRIKHALKEGGYKLTPQRRAIVDVIAGGRGYLTPLEVYQGARKNNRKIGLVTVYRTLEILAGMNLLCTVQGAEGQRSYILTRSDKHHHHLVCSGCGKVVNFAGCNLGELESSLSRKTGFKIENHVLEMHGHCRECQSAQASD